MCLQGMTDRIAQKAAEYGDSADVAARASAAGEEPGPMPSCMPSTQPHRLPAIFMQARPIAAHA